MAGGLTAAAAFAVVGVQAEKICVLAVGQAAAWVKLLTLVFYRMTSGSQAPDNSAWFSDLVR